MKMKINRVDMQVSILVAAIVAVSFICVYCFNYILTYHDMLYSLKERTESIYHYVEKNLDKSTFTDVNNIEDKKKNSYMETKKMLEGIKGATGVMYLYTAKQRDDGALIYIVDGLDADSPDFRNPGDTIEQEIWGDLQKALKDEIVLPDRIKETTWGYIFISYYPIHDNGRVVGVLGIEFEADHQYQTFRLIQIVTPIIAIIACLIAVFISVKLFKRISNPTYRDLSNTDQLTGLKNRNAFEVDMKNLISSNIHDIIGVVSIDLNGLKIVNDTYGHQAGDRYIRSAADIIQMHVQENEIVYRVGGDEFIILVKQAKEEGVLELVQKIEQHVLSSEDVSGKHLSLAIGYAIYDEEQDATLLETYQRADMKMYKNKKGMRD